MACNVMTHERPRRKKANYSCSLSCQVMVYFYADDQGSSHVHPVLIDVIQEAAGQLCSAGCLVYKVRDFHLTVLWQCTLIVTSQSHCICTMVTLALPDPHPSLTHHRWGDGACAAQHGNDPTPLTYIDSPAAIAPPKSRSSKQAVNRSTWRRDFPILNMWLLLLLPLLLFVLSTFSEKYIKQYLTDNSRYNIAMYTSVFGACLVASSTVIKHECGKLTCYSRTA